MAYCKDWNMERVAVPKLHEFDGKEATIIVVQMHTCVNDGTPESSKLLHCIICCLLEQEIKAPNNSVTKHLMVISVVIWSRIKYINAVMYEIDAVYAVVPLLYNWQKELFMTKGSVSEETISFKS